MEENLESRKIISATKWSFVTQVIAKMISPLTTLILAHILHPSAFGVVATVTMVVSFATMIADSGFQKYLIQHDFADLKERNDFADVAFWSNLVVSMLLWLAVAVFSEPLAVLVGNPGLGFVLVVAGVNIPLASFIGVQTGIYQRAYSFKALFWSRFVSSLAMIAIALPCALAGFDYWSMIAATIASNALMAVWLTVQSEWKPRVFFRFAILRRMLSFSVWSLLEACAIWLTSWSGAFIVGTVFDSAHLGMYKTSVSVVSGINGIVTGAIVPIIFASLSRLQNDMSRFRASCLKMQRMAALCIVPLSIGLFCFRDIATYLLLGEQWMETSLFLGLYAMMNGFCFLTGGIGSEAYRALGKPKYSLALQVVYLCFVIPGFYFSSLRGYDCFSFAVPAIDIVYCALHVAMMRYLAGIKLSAVFKSSFDVCVISCLVCLGSSAALAMCGAYIDQVLVLIVAIIAYAALSILVPRTRRAYHSLFRMFLAR